MRTPLNIKNPEVYKAAKQLSEKTGQTLTEVVKQALLNSLRLQQRPAVERELMIARLQSISERVSKLPDLDARTADEIIGYNEHGVPE